MSIISSLQNLGSILKPLAEKGFDLVSQAGETSQGRNTSIFNENTFSRFDKSNIRQAIAEKKQQMMERQQELQEMMEQLNSSINDYPENNLQKEEKLNLLSVYNQVNTDEKAGLSQDEFTAFLKTTGLGTDKADVLFAAADNTKYHGYMNNLGRTNNGNIELFEFNSLLKEATGGEGGTVTTDQLNEVAEKQEKGDLALSGFQIPYENDMESHILSSFNTEAIKENVSANISAIVDA